MPKRLVDALEANGLSVIDGILAVLGDKLDPSVVTEVELSLLKSLWKRPENT